jgi:cation diffusion facilitator family transporter
MYRPECKRCGERVGWIGIGVNLVMVILKLVVGFTAGSKACLADALHSASNIVTAFAIFISRRFTNKPIDEDHPWGHGKAEFIAAGAVSVIIMLITVALVVTSLKHLIYAPVPPPHLTAGLMAILSIITNEVLFRYFRCVGTELRSQTIIANAWANRADCFSSAAVIIGVVGSRLGFHHLDPVAAVFVAVIIVKVSISCIRDSIAGLMDRSVSTETLTVLKKVVDDVDEVLEIQHLRARLLGDKIWVDVAVQIDPKFTVSDCDQIEEDIKQCVLEGIQGVGKVLVEFVPLRGV